MLLVGLVVAVHSVCATPILFNLRDTSTTAEIESGVITRGGVEATLIPAVAGRSGVLNQTAAAFGVNAAGTGDASDLIDRGLGVESISIRFDADVLFTGLGLSALTSPAGDGACLKIAGFSALSLTDTGAGNDIYSFAANNLVAAGETVLLAFASGNGFSFDCFSIERVKDPAVPESLPSGYAAATLLGVLAVSRRLGRAAAETPNSDPVV